MNKLKICVTGANGFIGRVLVQSLSQKKYDVAILSRKNENIDLFPANVRWIKGDLTSDHCPLGQFLENCDVIFHCAGEVNNNETMKSLHIGGTQRLLQAALKETEQRGKKIHWIQLSSVGVYGPPIDSASKERVITENSPILPRGEYEITKAQADELLIHTTKNTLITYTIIRPSNVYGKNMPNGTLKSLANVIQKRLFFYIGNKNAVATYVHVDDVVELMIYCISDSCSDNEVFNISNDCLLKEMVESIAISLQVKPPRIRLPEAMVRVFVRIVAYLVKLPLTQEGINALVARTTYPTTKLVGQLNFTPKISTQEAINEVV